MERKETFWNGRSKHAVEGGRYKGRNPGRGKGGIKIPTEIMGVVKQFEKHTKQRGPPMTLPRGPG